MANKLLKLALFIMTLLSVISLSLTETHAECNARCYRENSQCCMEHPDVCGTKCFDEARKCYRECNNLIYLSAEK
jgi:hypothetical protein